MTHNNNHKNGHETSLQEDGMKGGAERDNLWSIVLAGGGWGADQGIHPAMARL